MTDADQKTKPEFNVVREVAHIFSDQRNFDENGFAKAELVTPELAEALWHISYNDKKRLMNLGCGFTWYKADASDGTVYKWFKNKFRGGTEYCLKIYYNQSFPSEIRRTNELYSAAKSEEQKEE